MLKSLKNYISVLLVAVLVVVSGYFIYVKINAKKLPQGLIVGSGRIDGDLILINTKYPARVENIFVEESDTIKKGQIIAKLVSIEFLSKYKSFNEMINSTENEKLSYKQTIDGLKMELELLEKTLPNLVKIKKDDLNRLKKTLDSIKLKIQTASFNYEQSKRDYKRYKELFKTKTISAEKFELVELKYKTTKKEFESLNIEKDKLSSSINIAKTMLQIQKDNLKKIDILKQNILSLKSSLNELKSMINELSLCSPVDGYIIEKVANEGEVVGAGGIVVTMSDRDSYYLKLFVDTINNGKIKIGDKAVIFVDAYPDKAIEAKITNISAKAEFTPKEVSVRSDRIQRVYEVHLKPIKFDPVLKLGIPAIGIISIDGTTLPSSLNEIPKI